MKQPLSKDVSKYVQTITNKYWEKPLITDHWGVPFPGVHEIIDARRPAARKILASSELSDWI